MAVEVRNSPSWGVSLRLDQLPVWRQLEGIEGNHRVPKLADGESIPVLSQPKRRLPLDLCVAEGQRGEARQLRTYGASLCPQNTGVGRRPTCAQRRLSSVNPAPQAPRRVSGGWAFFILGLGLS